jgi:hypothetical protein
MKALQSSIIIIKISEISLCPAIARCITQIRTIIRLVHRKMFNHLFHHLLAASFLKRSLINNKEILSIKTNKQVITKPKKIKEEEMFTFSTYSLISNKRIKPKRKIMHVRSTVARRISMSGSKSKNRHLQKIVLSPKSIRALELPHFLHQTYLVSPLINTILLMSAISTLSVQYTQYPLINSWTNYPNNNNSIIPSPQQSLSTRAMSLDTSH